MIIGSRSVGGAEAKAAELGFGLKGMMLIFLNRPYQVDGAGIRITGDMIEPAG